MAKIKFIQNREVKEIEIDDKSPILDQLEEAKIEIASSCRNGTCGVCACKIVKGADKLDQEKFGPDLMGFPEFLTCIGGLSSEANENDEITLEPLF